MKNFFFLALSCCFAFANAQTQEIPLPKLPSPESTFYNYLDNKQIANPEHYNGNVKKVIRTLKHYEQGVSPSVIQKDFMFMNSEGKLEKTIKRFYSYGVEDFKEVIHHLKPVKTFDTIIGKYTIKIIKETVQEDAEYMTNINGDDYYIYENDRLIAFSNDNDSVAFGYNTANKLITIRHMESQIFDQFDDDGNLTQWRSSFEDKVLEQIIYEKDQIVGKKMFDMYGEVYDIYYTTYSYTSEHVLTAYKTVYTRYLNDDYDFGLPIDQQRYQDFPKVTLSDSIQTGNYTYTKTGKLETYQMKAGKEAESYTIHYDANDQMHIVEGKLHYYKKGKFNILEVEYEYLYDDKGNPASIKSFYYMNGEKIIDKETIFEIEYD